MAPASTSTALANSIGALSPVSLTARPPRRFRTGLRRSVRTRRSVVTVPRSVKAHQPHVADYARRDDCCQPALLPRRQSFLRWSEWIVGVAPQGEQWIGGPRQSA